MVSFVILGEPDEIVAKLVKLKFLSQELSLQSIPAILGSFIFKSELGVSLSQVKQCQGVPILQFLLVDSSLVVAPKFPTLRLI